MLFRSVASQSVCGDFELTRGIAKGDEGETPKQDANGLGRKLFQSTHINCLRIISEPVAKVYTLDVEFAEFVTCTGSNKKLGEDTLNVTMSVIDVVDLCAVAAVLEGCWI